MLYWQQHFFRSENATAAFFLTYKAAAYPPLEDLPNT